MLESTRVVLTAHARDMACLRLDMHDPAALEAAVRFARAATQHERDSHACWQRRRPQDHKKAVPLRTKHQAPALLASPETGALFVVVFEPARTWPFRAACVVVTVYALAEVLAASAGAPGKEAKEAS